VTESSTSTPLATLDRFSVKQRVTLMVNRYEIRAGDQLVAMAEQKRMAFKEQVTFYADDKRRVPVFGFKARSVLDLRGTYDVTDAAGQPIGWFRKKFGASLLRTTWELSAVDGSTLVGRERSTVVALVRRVWDFLPLVGDLPQPFVYHLDFVDPAGQVQLSSVRRRTLRDRYEITVPQGRVDGRVAAAMAVALDALQGR